MEIWTKWTGEAVPLLTYIHEVLGSNLGRNISYSLLGFYEFPQCSQANSGKVYRLGRNLFPPNYFQFINHLIIRRYVVLLLTASLNKAPKRNANFGACVEILGYEPANVLPPHFIICINCAFSSTTRISESLFPWGFSAEIMCAVPFFAAQDSCYWIDWVWINRAPYWAVSSSGRLSWAGTWRSAWAEAPPEAPAASADAAPQCMSHCLRGACVSLHLLSAWVIISVGLRLFTPTPRVSHYLRGACVSLAILSAWVIVSMVPVFRYPYSPRE
jgi:hypothetical protein